MTHFLLRRFLFLILVLFSVSTIAFSLLRLIPGDPVEAMLGESAQPVDVLAMRKELLLDQPLAKQFGIYMWRLVHGDMGKSWSFREPVTGLIISRLPATLQWQPGR